MPALSEQGYVVRVSENSLISLILNALEAYCIRHEDAASRERTKLETFGSLFGYETRLADGKIIYQIEVANTDTSAKRRSGSVAYKTDAIALKIDTITSFWPNLDYLGEFHSHPYGDYKDANQAKGYYLSEGDRKDLSDNSEFWGRYRHRVGLLVTIGAMVRAGRRATQWTNSNCNCVEINLGNFKVWITAYCSYTEGETMSFTKDNDSLVTLDCPALTGLQWEHSDYGRVRGQGKMVDFIPSPSK